MRIVTVDEVITRNKESIDAVTSLVTDWLPIICKKAEIKDEDLEIIIMPMPYVMDEKQEAVQGLLFYDDQDLFPTQIQMAGIWLAGALYTDENDEEYLEVFDPGDDRFTRSVLETLAAVLLEMAVAVDGGLPSAARAVMRERLRESSVAVVTDLLGPPPEAWLEAPPAPKDKALN